MSHMLCHPPVPDHCSAAYRKFFSLGRSSAGLRIVREARLMFRATLPIEDDARQRPGHVPVVSCGGRRLTLCVRIGSIDQRLARVRPVSLQSTEMTRGLPGKPQRGRRVASVLQYCVIMIPDNGVPPWRDLHHAQPMSLHLPPRPHSGSSRSRPSG